MRRSPRPLGSSSATTQKPSPAWSSSSASVPPSPSRTRNNASPAAAWPSSHTQPRSSSSHPISGWSVPLSSPYTPSHSLPARRATRGKALRIPRHPLSVPKDAGRPQTLASPPTARCPPLASTGVHRVRHTSLAAVRAYLLRQSTRIVDRTLPCHATEARGPGRYPDRLVSTYPAWRLRLTYRRKSRSNSSTRPRSRERGAGPYSVRGGSRIQETFWWGVAESIPVHPMCIVLLSTTTVMFEPYTLDVPGQHISDQHQRRLCKGDHIVPPLLVSRIDRPSDHAFLGHDGEVRSTLASFPITSIPLALKKGAVRTRNGMPSEARWAQSSQTRR